MKVLIVTEVIAGNGHHKAAESLLKTIKSIEPQHDVKIVHLLAVVNRPLEQLIKKIYLSLILRKPMIWGWIYQRESNFAFLFKQLIAYAMFIKLDRFIKKEKPDLILATHASGLTALAKLKKRNQYDIAAIFTDYHLNRFWVHPNIDYYYVGHAELKERLENRYQIAPSRVIVSGIPIDPEFSQTPRNIKKDQKETFHVLIMGGGLGIGAILETVHSLKSIRNVKFSVTVITGRNDKLYQTLQDDRKHIDFPIEILSYVKNIYDVLLKSHLIITKPGGLTISEALATSTPILMVRPIPGQEEYNARFLIKNHAALRVNEVRYVPYWVEYLYHNPKLYNKMKQYQSRVANPNSSTMIIKDLFKRKQYQE